MHRGVGSVARCLRRAATCGLSRSATTRHCASLRVATRHFRQGASPGGAAHARFPMPTTRHCASRRVSFVRARRQAGPSTRAAPVRFSTTRHCASRCVGFVRARRQAGPLTRGSRCTRGQEVPSTIQYLALERIWAGVSGNGGHKALTRNKFKDILRVNYPAALSAIRHHRDEGFDDDDAVYAELQLKESVLALQRYFRGQPPRIGDLASFLITELPLPGGGGQIDSWLCQRG